MVNPVAELRTWTSGGKLESETVITWCPGCNNLHPFRIKVYPGFEMRKDGTPNPTWEWDGNLEKPTFSPSLLCYSSVHVCPPDYVHFEVCEDHENCGQVGHAYLTPEIKPYRVDTPPETERLYGHMLPHAVNPGYGNCHSFLTAGVWDFLSDSAHHLAGQKVPMVPLPDWMTDDDY